MGVIDRSFIFNFQKLLLICCICSISLLSIKVTLFIAGDLLDRIPSGTVQVLSPDNQANTPQFSETFKSDTLNNDDVIRPDDAEIGEADHDEHKSVDPLDKFLPPPPKVKCSEELQVSSVKMVLITIVDECHLSTL